MRNNLKVLFFTGGKVRYIIKFIKFKDTYSKKAVLNKKRNLVKFLYYFK